MRILGAAFAALLIVACTPAAIAADKGGPNPLLPPLFDDADLSTDRPHRTGLYAGILAGYNAGQLRADDFRFSDHNPFVGGFVGINARVSDGLVLGIEGDYVFTDFNASWSDGGGFTAKVGSDYLASIRGRAGLPVGIALLYVTGGVAFTDVDASVVVGNDTYSDSATLIGGVLGAGIEIELTRTAFVRVEGMHYWFPDEGLSDEGQSVKADVDQTAVRLGFGMKF